MWVKGYIVGGLLIVALCLAAAFAFIWLNVAAFNSLGYQKGLVPDGVQLAAIFGGSIYRVRRIRNHSRRHPAVY